MGWIRLVRWRDDQATWFVAKENEQFEEKQKN